MQDMREFPETEEIIVVKKFSAPEKKKIRVIKKMLAGRYNGAKAARLLQITPRQVRNLKKQIINEGDAGIVHKNRYHKPANTYHIDIRKDLAKIYRKSYRGTNFTRFATIMQTEFGFKQARSTIYNILREQGIRSPQRKRKKRNVGKK